MWRSIETYLHAWQLEKERTPLMIRGARQVGKSYTVEKFGRECFMHLAVANFEYQPQLHEVFNTLDPVLIVQKLEPLLNVPIVPNKTLLFLDEIQLCPQAILSLRYFKEKMPNLHVISAGSLVEFTLNDLGFSFPVGRIQFLYMKPMSFYEFLINQKQELLVKWIEDLNLQRETDKIIHDRARDFLRQYWLVGGMPSAVKVFIETQSVHDAQKKHQIIIQNYFNDFGKYAAKTKHKLLQHTFYKVPHLIGQQVKYSHIDAETKSRDIKEALQLLNMAGLIHKVSVSSASGLPLAATIKEKQFKLMFLDIGLWQTILNTPVDLIFHETPMQINKGVVAEYYVGLELISYIDAYRMPELYYWKKDKPSIAEIDYILPLRDQILPIEVKSGSIGHLKSLQQFMNDKKPALGIKIADTPLSLENNLLSLPLYGVFILEKLVESILLQM